MTELQGYSYRHIHHILSSKVARVPGFSLITIPQGVAAIAGLVMGVASENVLFGFVFIVIGFFSLSMYQGEFALVRLISVLYTAILVRSDRAKTVDLTVQWAAIQIVKEDRPAAVYKLPGIDVVAGKG